MSLMANPNPGVRRTRWAAIGAAVAVTLGAGGLLTASAASSTPSAFVAVVPVRVVDTRSGLGLGGALESQQPELFDVTGSLATPDGSATVVPARASQESRSSSARMLLILPRAASGSDSSRR